MPRAMGDTPARPAPPLLDRYDVLLMILVTAVAMALRFAWFSGYGLGDDILVRHAVAHYLQTGIPPGANFTYRFTWWVPTVLLAGRYGVGEMPMVLPNIVFDVFLFPVGYALGKAFFGRVAGIMAALLLLATPLDFAWASMITPDIMLTTLLGGIMLCVLRAGEEPRPWRCRLLLVTAVILSWLAFHVKGSAMFIAVPVLFTFWRYRRALGWNVLWFFVAAVIVFGATGYFYWWWKGDPLFAPHSELSAQGLSGPEAAKFHQLTSYVFWLFPNALFFPSQYGDLVFGLLPHALVVFALTGWAWGARLRAPELWVWLVVVFLAMQLNIQHTEGVWVAGFRNIRHVHFWILPMAILVAGYLEALYQRWTRVGVIVGAVLVLIGLVHSIDTARLTAVSFDDRREACRFVYGLPPKTIYSDFQIETWCAVLVPAGEMPRSHATMHWNSLERRTELANLKEGYLITGGGREPHYGCIDCIPLESEMPADRSRFRLLTRFPRGMAPARWRAEDVAVWEVVPPAAPPPADTPPS
jgi:4-amino-4-deoxy-L-arabinose transferase-like glycosyltransferase